MPLYIGRSAFGGLHRQTFLLIDLCLRSLPQPVLKQDVVSKVQPQEIEPGDQSADCPLTIMSPVVALGDTGVTIDEKVVDF